MCLCKRPYLHVGLRVVGGELVNQPEHSQEAENRHEIPQKVGVPEVIDPRHLEEHCTQIKAKL